jgi:DNA repair protein RadC
MKKNTIKKYELTLKHLDTELIAKRITSSKDSAEYIRQFYFDDIEIYESSFILLLNRQNKVLGYAKISQGGVTGTVIDPKIVCKYAVDSLATGIILAHNHPSGNTQPSSPDRDITCKLKSALSYFDIQLIDHIIITADAGYYSFADEGII